MNKFWLLTEEYNEYYQHGEYFVAAFATKPTAEQLAKHIKPYTTPIDALLESGGGRSCRMEDHWYNLREEVLQ
jgi:hypothetical protein